MGLSFPFPFIDVLTLPTDAGPGEGRIVIDGVNGEIIVYNSTGFPVIVLTANGAQGQPDISYVGRSFARGERGRTTTIGNDVARAPGDNTDMDFLVDLVNGRSYRVKLHTRINYGTAGLNAIALKKDGTVVDHFQIITTTSANYQETIDAECDFIATSTQTDAEFRVSNSTFSAGSISLLSAADHIRQFSIEDIGANA